jgi:hypothetical protein
MRGHTVASVVGLGLVCVGLLLLALDARADAGFRSREHLTAALEPILATSSTPT